MSVREKTAVLVRCNDLERRLVETEQCLAAAEIQIALLETINGKWQDETKLTLDVLRRELGAPRANSRAGVRWVTPSGQFVVWLSHYDNAMVGEMIVETLGQLRRILSVINETNGGGAAAK